MVRPHLEYANQVWAPRLQRQIDSLENVQRRATKLVPGFKDMSYENRLKALNLPTLAYRRLRGDVIELYKIVSGKYDPEVCKDFIKMRKDVTPKGMNTRGNAFKIFKEFNGQNLRKNSFPHRIVNIWNSLPAKVVNAPSIMCFESRFDRFSKHQDIKFDYRAKYKLSDTGSDNLEVYADLDLEAQ